MDDIRRNPNAEWLYSSGIWSAYLVLIFTFYFFVYAFSSSAVAWTITNITHCLITFVTFHWLKGLPFIIEQQGKYSRLTLWEQIDGGKQYTPTRKFLVIVPLILYAITVHASDYDWTYFCVNLFPTVLVLIPKAPGMFRVRIFGINS